MKKDYIREARFFFFVVAPFCSCHASLVSRKFFAVGPGCAKCFFLLRSVGRRDLSAGPEQKKKPPRVFFFFLLRPRGKAHPGGVFFLLWPRAGAQRGFSFPGFSPSLAFRRGRSKKKNTLGGVFFFAAAPRGRSLTHCGPGWRCLPLAGVVFLFFAAAPPGPGWCFFFAVAPPGRSLTHGGLRRFRQGPGGVFFFLLRPRRVFLDNNKKCLGYYIGSKKTRRGHSKKKHHFLSGMQGLCNLGGALIILEH